MDIQKILEHAVETNVSDAFMIAGLPISYRKNGAICQETEQKLLPADTESMITELYALANNRSMDVLLVILTSKRIESEMLLSTIKCCRH